MKNESKTMATCEYELPVAEIPIVEIKLPYLAA
jgi:hypothetical protein